MTDQDSDNSGHLWCRSPIGIICINCGAEELDAAGKHDCPYPRFCSSCKQPIQDITDVSRIRRIDDHIKEIICTDCRPPGPESDACDADSGYEGWLDPPEFDA